MWLLDKTTHQSIENAYSSGFQVDEKARSEYEARFISEEGGSNQRILSIAGDTAQINVEGVLTEKPDFIAALFGGGNTTYEEIAGAIATAEADSAVDKINFFFNSPGGMVSGLFDAMALIGAIEKPTKAVVKKATSAAYGLASQANSIEASGVGAQVGSIGVMYSAFVDPEQVTITSTDAPKKAPDVTTEEGRGIVREQLDALHEIFVGAIADGRETSVENVNSNFGQGAVLLAEEAFERGMVDKVSGVPLRVVESSNINKPANGGKQTEAKNMDLNQFRTEHPDVYAAAVQAGVDGERDRVCAHLTMGEASGDLKTAFEAIKGGSEMTMTLQTQYMAAGMNKTSIEAREKDNEEVETASEEDDSSLVVKLVSEQLGTDLEVKNG